MEAEKTYYDILKKFGYRFGGHDDKFTYFYRGRVGLIQEVVKINKDVFDNLYEHLEEFFKNFNIDTETVRKELFQVSTTGGPFLNDREQENKNSGSGSETEIFGDENTSTRKAVQAS